MYLSEHRTLFEIFASFASFLDYWGVGYYHWRNKIGGFALVLRFTQSVNEKDCPLKSYSMPNQAEDAANLEVRTAKSLGLSVMPQGIFREEKGGDSESG